MIRADADGVTRGDDEGAVTALAMAKWLRFAAAPTFMIMTLLPVVLDSGPPNAICLATGHARFGGMATMYLLMAVFHSAPWLRLICRW
jgi:hypothetical protein